MIYYIVYMLYYCLGILQILLHPVVGQEHMNSLRSRLMPTQLLSLSIFYDGDERERLARAVADGGHYPTLIHAKSESRRVLQG
jgi:hypothetical protein